MEKKVGIAIVRDKNGNVKFDDWNNIPEIFHAALTPADWEYIKERQNGTHT